MCYVIVLSMLLLVCSVVFVVVEVSGEYMYMIRFVIFLGSVGCWMIDVVCLVCMKFIVMLLMLWFVLLVCVFSIVCMFFDIVGFGSIELMVMLVLVVSFVRLCVIDSCVVFVNL